MVDTAFHKKQASQVTAGMPTSADFTGQVCVDSTGDPDVYINTGGDNWHSLGAAAAHDIDGVLHNPIALEAEDYILAFDGAGFLKNTGQYASQWQSVEEELKILAVSDDDVPEVDEGDALVLWKDTNDSDRIFLIFNNSGSTQQFAVELT